MKPAIGRIVHHYDCNDVGPTAAIITATYEGRDDVVDLHLFPDSMARRNAPVDVAKVPRRPVSSPEGSWCWPPRVE